MLSQVTIVLRAEQNQNLYAAFFQKVFEINAGKALQTGSTGKLQLRELGVMKSAKNYEKVILTLLHL